MQPGFEGDKAGLAGSIVLGSRRQRRHCKTRGRQRLLLKACICDCLWECLLPRPHPGLGSLARPAHPFFSPAPAPLAPPLPSPPLPPASPVQVLWATFSPHSTTLLPGQITLAAGCAVLAAETAGRLPPALRGAWAAASAWTATALFMLQPVSQLVVNFTDPASLQGLSLATILLAAAGNALMVPRALWTRDWVWLAGSLWGSLFFGWAQLLSMFLGRSPATGLRFLPTPLFATATVLLWAWFALTFTQDARARRKTVTA